MTNKERKFKFALVGHSLELANLVMESYNQGMEEVEAKVVSLDEAVPQAKKLLKNGAEVILGHGGTGKLILQVWGQPVVNIPRTELDIITAFLKARRYGKRIGLTSFASPTNGIDIIARLLNVEVRQLIFNNKTELEHEVHTAYSDGIHVIVGGGTSRKTIVSLGGKGIVVLPSQNIVQESLKEARAIASARRGEAENAERIKTILQMTEDGVISIDKNGKIDVHNEVAERILGQHIFRLGEKSQTDLLNELNLIDVLNGDQPKIDVITKIQGKNMLVNTHPVKVDGKARGAVAFIREVERIENISRKLKENLYLKGFVARHNSNDIKGESKSVKALLENAKKYAATDATILIQGETGTGKGLLAESIHNLSPRRLEPFVAVNCPALPEGLLESELFGYEEGAFTGAKRGGKVGLFEMANNGTIFLDEIADIPHSVQVRLLRVVEAKEVMRVGGDRYVPVDVRIISSSNKDLRREVKDGKFRNDLYFRLAFLKLSVPPLRDRFEDMTHIIRDLIIKYNESNKETLNILPEKLKDYSWPGNIRELRSFMESYFILTNDSTDHDLSVFDSLLNEYRFQNNCDRIEQNESEKKPVIAFDRNLKEQIREYEKIIINNTLEACQFNKKAAAIRLGISANTLWRKMQ